MATLAITLSEVKKNIGLLLGIGRDPDNDWDADTIADVDRIIRAGRRKFFASHEWRHLEETYTVVTPVVYETGTVTVVDGVVTVSAGTLPTDAADYVFLPADGGVYEIATRDGATQFTLEDTSLDLDAGTSYAIRRVHFPLPDGFAAFISPITIANSRDFELLEVPVLPEWTVRSVGSITRARTGRPEMFSLYQTVDDETGVFTPYLTVYPIPDQQYTLTGRVRVEPGDALNEAGVIAHALFSELMQEAILAAAEEMYLSGGSTIHTNNFQAWLPRFIRRDGVARSARRLRPRRTDRQLTRDQAWWAAHEDIASDLPFNE